VGAPAKTGAFYMNYFDAILLGIIQGLTEFLPVSSSGHLVLAEHFLHAKMPGVVFELLLHFGTLLAVLIYFRKKISSLIKSLFDSRMITERRMILFLLLGSIPAGIAGLLFKDFFEAAFGAPLMTSVMLMMTGLILLATGLVRKRNREMNLARSIIVGIGQAVAILPGISRSGATISAGLFCGVKPVEAAEFSFLLSIPAIGGAILLKAKEIFHMDMHLIGQYLSGTLISLLLGLFSVYMLLGIIKRGKFVYFGIYCLLAGAVGVYHFM
jgi:undecaprenyl-diphosphatase